MPLKYEIFGEQDFNTQLVAHAERFVEKPEEFWNDIGVLVVFSVTQNFDEGGNPIQWQPSQRVLKHGGKTLIKSGKLQQSSHVFDITQHGVDIVTGLGLPYAFIHQYGGPAGRGHASYIPIRRYSLLQEEDVIRIQNMFNQFYSTGEWDSIN